MKRPPSAPPPCQHRHYARSVITCYGATVSSSSCSNDGYDALNRPTVKSYSDGTPQVTYSYGDALPTRSIAVANAAGRLTQTSNGISATNILGYDALGRVTSSSQTPQGSTTPFTFSYLYNLAGSLISETLPSGRVIATTYDAANRPSSVQGNPASSSPTNYVGTSSSPIQYTPHGATWSFSRGNGLTHTEDYNTRLQLVQSYESLQNTNDPAHMLFVSCPQWGFGAAGTQPNVICPANPAASDNGNLLGYIEYLGNLGATNYTTINQPTITYDGVNRLTSITETNNWSRSFAYDQWGNMSIASATGITLTQLDVNAPVATDPSSIYNAKNQRKDAGLGYDSAGNLTAMNLFTLNSIQYDAENRLINESHPAAYSYGYDGDGHRVTKTAPGNAITTYVYDAAGQLSAEYNNAAPPAPACLTCYLSYDHLGSVRLITDAGGAVIARHDFLPFGEEIPANIGPRSSSPGFGSADYVSQRFTGKERDAESSLDYFGARYYGSALGRFGSPDPTPFGIAPGDPQSWNLYSYTRNRPTVSVDTNGKWYTPIHREMVQIALGGLLSAGEISQLQHRQDVMDSHASDMSDQRGHYMAVPNQNPIAAQQNADQLIADNIAAANLFTDANGVMSSAGLDFLGDAIHTAEDMTSPMHTSGDRTPLVWYGAFGTGGTNGLLHFMGENTPADSWARFGQAIRVTLAAWIEANPAAAAKRGITPENFENEANRRTADYIGRFFSGLNDPVLEDAARQCASGNRAACP